MAAVYLVHDITIHYINTIVIWSSSSSTIPIIVPQSISCKCKSASMRIYVFDTIRVAISCRCIYTLFLNISGIT